MCTEFSCVGCQPVVLSAPLAFSCAFFFGTYGPPLETSLTQVAWFTTPQSLYGTWSRPTVQSMRGSTGVSVDALRIAFDVFHVPFASYGLLPGDDVSAIGRPAPSTLKKLMRFCVG